MKIKQWGGRGVLPGEDCISGLFARTLPLDFWHANYARRFCLTAFFKKSTSRGLFTGTLHRDFFRRIGMNLIGRECRLRDLEGSFLAWLFVMAMMSPYSQVDALDPFT